MPKRRKKLKSAEQKQKKRGQERDKKIVLNEIEKNLNEVLARAREAEPRREDNPIPSGRAVIGEEDFARVDKIEREKRIMMWSGIIFFMALVVVGWFFSVKKVFMENRLASSNNEINWVKMAEDFNKTMEEMKKGLSQVRSVGNENSATSSPQTAEINAATGTLPIDEDVIRELRGQLENK